MLIKANIKNIYSLTPMQEGMLYHSTSEKTSAYNVQLTLTLEGDLTISKMEEALNLLICKYDVFRTVFSYKKTEKPRQIVLKERKIVVDFEDISQLKEKDEHARKFKQTERNKIFNLSQDLLIRATILKIKDDKHQLVLTIHHILFDGWCLRSITEDLFSFYFDLEQSNSLVLIEKRLKEDHPYSQFIYWLEKQDQSIPLEYWKNYLKGFEIPSKLPRNKSSNKSFEHKIEEIWLDESLTSNIKEASSNLHITVNAILQSCWGILLSKYNNSDDIVFGTVVSGRPSELAGVEKMVGLLINTIPMRMKFSSEASFKTLAQQFQDDFSKSQQYSFSPLSEIQSLTEVKNELIDHIFVLENYPLDENANNSGSLAIKDVEFIEETSFDFNIIINPGDQYKVIFNYNKALFPEHFTQRLIKHYTNILTQVVNNPDINFADILLITSDERLFLLENHSIPPAAPYPSDKSIIDVFEKIVDNHSDHAALRSETALYTYKQLNARANQLAHTLVSKGIKTEDVVALIMERSPELVIAQLAILKAGGAYLPIDIKYPISRINEVIEDSGAKIALIQSSELLKKYDVIVPYLLMDDEGIYNESQNNLLAINQAHNLAYVMYTSGSTGRPKGVMIEHRNVVRLVQNTNYLNFSSDIRTIQGGAPSFDAATFEIWGPLLNGGLVCTIEEQDILDSIRLQAKLEYFNINTLWLTTSLLNQLVEEDASIFVNLKYLLTGGDIISPKHIEAVKAACPNLMVLNGYGPTENTTFSTYFPIEKKYNESVPIGYPISNSTCYIVDSNMQILPVGVVGELCVGGDGVGRGYIGNIEATNEKFVNNPFHPGRLYKTGDLAYWLEDGSIEFVGRKDSQIKIRGFRVELGDIELKVLSHPDVKEAVVLLTENKEISVYFTAKRAIDSNELKAFLKKELPNYMLPAYTMQLKTIPLNSNGKIDKKHLPHPKLNENVIYWAPRNEIEEELQKIWNQLFNMDSESGSISIDDDFFQLGGHSMKAMKMASIISNTLDIEIPINAIFENASIAELAEYIAEQMETIKEKLEVPVLKSIPESQFYELTPAQKSFMYQYSPHHKGNSISNVFLFKGGIDIDKFKDILDQLIQRHEYLRATFEYVDGRYIIKINKKIDSSIEVENIVAQDKDKIDRSINDFFRPFDLSKELPYRFKIIHIGEDSILAMDIEHTILDGASLSVFFTEYLMLSGGAELSPLTVNYRDYAAWQQELLASEYINPQREFWHKLMKLPINPLKLPEEFANIDYSSRTSKRLQLEMGGERFEKLKRYNANNGITMQMYFLALTSIVMHKYTKQDDILFVRPIIGRKLAEFDDVIGLFAEILPTRTFVQPEQSVVDLFHQVRETSSGISESQDYPLDVLLSDLGIPADTAYEEFFSLGFSYLNADIGGGNLEDFNISRYPANLDYDLRLPLLVELIEQKEDIIIGLNHRISMFRLETIEEFSNMFLRFTDAIINADSDKLKISDLK